MHHSHHADASAKLGNKYEMTKKKKQKSKRKSSVCAPTTLRVFVTYFLSLTYWMN